MSTPGKTVRVRDIMTTPVITLGAGTSVDDAARSLTSNHVSGAPVLEHGRIVGVVTKSDLVDPRFRAPSSEPLKVRDAMTKAVRAVRPGDPAMMAVHLMVDDGVHRVVVVDERGKLAGIVSSLDILRALGRGDRLQEGDAAYEERKERHAEPASATTEPVVFVDLAVYELNEGA